jgi:hypothetical protein
MTASDVCAQVAEHFTRYGQVLDVVVASNVLDALQLAEEVRMNMPGLLRGVEILRQKTRGGEQGEVSVRPWAASSFSELHCSSAVHCFQVTCR